MSEGLPPDNNESSSLSGEQNPGDVAWQEIWEIDPGLVINGSAWLESWNIDPESAFEEVDGRERYTGPVPSGGGTLINPRTRSWQPGPGPKIMIVDAQGFIIGHQG